MAVVRNLIVRAGADFSSLRSEMNKAKKNIADFKSSIQGAVGGLGLALAGAGFGALAADATRTAMDVEAAMQQINRLMGQSSNEFNEWARESAGAFNMSYGAAVKYGAIFGNLLSTFSSGAEDTKNKTVDMLKASAVVASGTGRTMEDVMWRIRSGLLGNTEAIEDLGINVYVNMLESTEAFRRFAGDKSWDQLDFQTQQLIRYYGILEQANKKFGAEINVNTNSALQQFQAALGNVKLALGQAFLPIVSHVLPMLTALANWLFKIITIIGTFLRVLFGFKDPAKKVNKSVGTSIGGVGDAYKSAGDAAKASGGAAKKSAKDTEKAAKKAKKAVESLAGFDEINKLASAKDQDDPSSSVGGGGGGGGAGGGGGIGGGLGDFGGFDPGTASVFEEASEKVRKAAEKLRAIFLGLKNFLVSNKEIIIAALGGIATALAVAFIGKNWGKIIGGIGGAFKKLGGVMRAAWMAIISPIGLVIAAIALVTGAFIYFYRNNEAFRGFVDGILLSIKNVLIDLWQNVLVPFATWLWGVFTQLWEQMKPVLADLWNNVLVPLGKWLATTFVNNWKLLSEAAKWLWKNVMIPLGDYLKVFYKDVIVPLGKLLKDVFAVSLKIVSEVAKSLWKNVIVPLANFMKDNWEPIVKGLIAVFTWLWNNVLKPLATFMGATLLNVFKGIVNIATVLWKEVLKPLAEFLLNRFKANMETIGKVIDGLSKVFKGFMQFLSGVFQRDWDKAWTGMKNMFKGTMETLWSVAKGPLNRIIDGINQVISGMNRIKVRVPDWVPEYGGRSFGMSIPKIPRLAQGGYIGANKPLMAMIGDNRNEGEIVAPESKLYEQAYKAISDAMNGKNQEIVINIGGTTVFRKVIDGINKAQRQAGKTLIEV